MTIQRRWARALIGCVGAMALGYSLSANGGAGGKPANHGGAGGGGGGRAGGASAGAMRPMAPGGGGGSRQPSFNSMAGARPTNGANMPRGGMTGQSAAMRQNNPASRPDLGLGGGGTALGSAQNSQMRQPANRPSFNPSSSQGNGSSLAGANRRDLGALAGPGGLAQAGGGRRPGLAPTIKPADLERPAGSDLAGVQPGARPAFPGRRPSISGSNGAGSLAGFNRPRGPNIPSGRPDLGGGGLNNRPDVAFKPDLTKPNRPDQGILPNRPNRPDGSNRPDLAGGQRPGWPNRPGGNINNGNINSGNIGSGNNIWNRTNNNWNVNNNWVSNRQNIINNSPTIINTGYRPGFAVPGYGYGCQGNWGYGTQGVYDNSWQCGPGWAPAYSALHDNWCHGSWNGYGGNSNWLGGFASGAATGWLTNWMFGSRQYQWGYSSYSNPYYSSTPQTDFGAAQTLVAPYNYSQPINTEAPPPAQDQVTTAAATLDQARDAFAAGNYSQALNLANNVLTSLPNDATVHQFRALTLFALGRYQEASETLYPVLSVGPGWDWTTMSGLYPSEQPYKQQLAALEDYVQSHADMASPRFLLAYHYLTLGSPDAAADQLRQVVQLKPTDGLSRQMLALLDSAKQSATVAEQAPAQQPAPQPAPTAPSLPPQATIPPAALVGTWSAKPDDKTAIKLTLAPDGKFIWDVNGQNGQNQLRGSYTMGDGNLLTLAQDQQGGTLAGNIAKAQNGGFSFRLMGAPQSDPGLTFVRQL
jgi:tetratricopeptide (TPR) repeat protein